MKKKSAIACGFLSLLIMSGVFVMAANHRTPVAKQQHVKLGATLGAGNVTTTVTKGMRQPGYNLGGSQSFVGTQPTAYESDLALSSGTAGVLVTGGIASCPSPQYLQAFYAQIDSTSGTIQFYSSSAGTGAIGTAITLQAGSPYMWDQGLSTTAGTGTATPWGGAAFQSFKLTTAGTSSTSGGTATNVHIHGSLSQ